jgi:hypothetical protein
MSTESRVCDKLFFFFFPTCLYKREREIQTSILRFMKCSSQLIELPFEDCNTFTTSTEQSLMVPIMVRSLVEHNMCRALSICLPYPEYWPYPFGSTLAITFVASSMMFLAGLSGRLGPLCWPEFIMLHQQGNLILNFNVLN